ncbi:MAG: PQQ-binding-like beta-propeller repeat protein [Gemmataceae bacterium]
MSRPLLALLLVASPALADNWPQWRGPTNDGICRETSLPTKWSESEGVAWKLKMPGLGGATPCVWGDHIFLTSEEGKDLVLLCVGTDGKERWKKTLGPTPNKNRNAEVNFATASPSTDGKHVFAFVGSGDFAAFDFAGNEVWHFNAQERWGKFRIQFGVHSTPVLDGDRLYLQLIHDGGGFVIAVDKATGNDVWKVERPSDGYMENKHSYASASVWRKGADALLIVHGNDYTTAHRLDTGAEVWRVAGLNPKERYNPTLRFVASPLTTPDLIVIPSAKSGPVVGLDPTAAKGTIDQGNPAERWRKLKGTPDVPSPLLVDGLVYLCRETGNLTCLDAATGQEYYAEQRTQTGRHRASPVWADGKVYTTCRDTGTVTVVKAGREFKVLETNKLPDTFAASPAISGGRIYLRGFDYLWAVGK